MFTIYTKKNCPYCVQAKTLMKMKGDSFEEKSIETDSIFDEMKEVAPYARTMPQIIKEDKELIGGFTELLSYYDNK